jgi:hypothetical protein
MKKASLDPKGKAMIENTKGAATAKEVAGDARATEIESGTATAKSKEEDSAAEIKAEAIVDEAKAEAAPAPVPTLRQVFEFPEKGDTDPADDRWQAMQERISQEVKGIKWTAAMPDLIPKICDLLEIKVDDVLLTAWKKASELWTVIEKSKQTPEETTYVELAQHTINSEHKPSIDVMLKGAKLKTIALLVQLGFNLKGFVLKVKNGGIIELQAGQCEVKGTIKFSGLTIAEKKLAPLKLPFSIPVTMPASVPQLTAEPHDENEKQTAELERIEL